MIDRFLNAVVRHLNVRSVAGAGIVLGVAAFLLTLPPFTLRTTLVPIIFGLGALALGLAAISQGERRLGGFALAIGFLGTIGGLWAQGVDRDTLEAVLTGGLVASTLRFATPLAYAAMGGIFSERSGVVNIGLEGMMLMGAFFAVWGSIETGSWVVGIVTAMISGGLLALIHAVFSIHLRADQIVSGFAVNLLALGLTGYLYSSIYPDGTPTERVDRVPTLRRGVRLPELGSGERPEPARVGDAGRRDPLVRRALQDSDRPPDPLGRRAPAGGGHGRHLGVRRPLRRCRDVRAFWRRSAARSSRSASRAGSRRT